MSRKSFVIFMGVVFVSLLVFGFSGCNQTEKSAYEKTEIQATVVKISGSPNVREEAILQDREDNNSLGCVKRDGFTIQVNGLLKANIDHNNGVYYGFRVEDLKTQPEGEWFPSGIEKDEDGIVWINHKYITIIL